MNPSSEGGTRIETFPTGAAYVDALHHPDACLTDPRLFGSRVECTDAGWPRPRSGTSACVFRLDGADGRRYALKCFTRPAPGQHRRYAGIAARLAEEGSGWQVTFEYQAEGILIDGRRWPVLLMEWVDGAQNLAGYVESRLHRPASLGALATDFAALCTDLSRRGIAHGDLQHGNLLVARAGIRLIDYDGMWVPELAGEPGIEFGQPNYQHPARRQTDAGPGLDHFSSWVIYVSLLAAASDPGLWARCDGGDECLLLRAADFADPDGSEAFAALAESPAPIVREAGARLADLCRCPDTDQVPPLDATVLPVPPLPRRRTVPNTPSRHATLRSGPATVTAPPGPERARGIHPDRRWPGGARRASASSWSRRPRVVRALRAAFALRRGRVWPGGTRPRRNPAASWAILAVIGLSFVITCGVRIVGGQSSEVSPGYRPPVLYSPPPPLNLQPNGVPLALPSLDVNNIPELRCLLDLHVSPLVPLPPAPPGAGGLADPSPADSCPPWAAAPSDTLPPSPTGGDRSSPPDGEPPSPPGGEPPSPTP